MNVSAYPTTESRAGDIIKRCQRLDDDRALFIQQWRELNYICDPSPDYFNMAVPTPGEKRTYWMFDETSTLALDKFAAAVSSALTPSTKRWAKLGSKIEDLNQNHEVKEWFDNTTDKLFNAIYDPEANFANQMNECYRSLGKYGTTGLFIDDDPGKGIRFKSIHISELYIVENKVGIVDTVYRRFRLTATQAVEQFGMDNLPPIVKEDYRLSPDNKKFYIHLVEPNTDHDPRYKNSMRYKSTYIQMEEQHIISEGGYRVFPYAISRYRTNAQEMYGRSPGIDTLPANKMLQQMAKTNIRSAQLVANPPILLAEDGALQSFQCSPGAINKGAIDSNGRPLAVPLQTGGRVEVSLEMMDRQRQIINEAFLITLFQILVETPTMTATEAMYRQQEKASLLAPMIGRQQTELLAPLIDRCVDILAAAGVLDPLPDALLEMGGEYEITYISPFSIAQKADEGIGIMNTLQAAASVAQFDPNIVNLFDLEEAMRTIADIQGAPAKILKSKEVVAQMDAEAAQQAQLQQMLQAAPVVAKTVESLGRAQELTGQSAPRIAA